MAKKILVKDAHFHAGLDLIGSKQSMHHRLAEMEATALGIMVTSRKTKRIILMPWANVKGCEIFSEEEAEKVELKQQADEKQRQLANEARERAQEEARLQAIEEQKALDQVRANRPQASEQASQSAQLQQMPFDSSPGPSRRNRTLVPKGSE